jgi:hypothetical protein
MAANCGTGGYCTGNQVARGQDEGFETMPRSAADLRFIRPENPCWNNDAHGTAGIRAGLDE